MSVLHRLHVRWRRWRLLRAYEGVFRARTGKPVGFTPMLYAMQALERDGLGEIEDGEVVWYWSEWAEDVDEQGRDPKQSTAEGCDGGSA